MSFIVRQISRTADGREIVRPTRFDKAELSVGRDPSCDIHLADLAVTLRHAVIRREPNGQVEVSASAGIPFDVDGRQAERAEVDPAKGGDIRFGSHLIAVGRGEGDDAEAIVLSVERVGALSDASEAKDERKVFSLAASLPGKRRMAWSLALTILALCLLWPVVAFYTNGDAQAGEARPVAFHADEMWSPGKLSNAHAGLENNCKACHQQPGVVVADQSCVVCHTKVHDHADPRRLAAAPARPGPLQQASRAVSAAFNRPEGRCADCHIEHEGRGQMPTTPQKFCADCHADLSKRLTDTKILDAADFGTRQGHPQFRPLIATRAGAVPTVQRLSLDARPLEDNGLKFPHALHLSTNNGVARMAATLGARAGFGKALVCADCHVPDASGVRFRPVEMEKNCQMCHDLAFDKVGPTYRTLRHGDPAQVVAELRAFYRSGGPTRPIGLQSMRRRPGNSGATIAPGHGGSADAAIRAV
ncbi:MAG TPA: cytochrome c3 family protein, partial [Sphingomonadaceae bacterium]|nr:cytochrome c3 family protein [Sphingomonadaceae bacterium]